MKIVQVKKRNWYIYYVFALVLIPFFFNKAQGQIRYGLGLEYSYNYLTKVIPEELTPYGHSGKQSNQRSSTTISPFIYAQKNIFNRKWAVNMGLGYARYQHYFDFKYLHRFGGGINSTLKIDLQYIQIPVALCYDLKLNPKNSIIFQAGPRINVLLRGRDNFLDIILEEIWLIYRYFPASIHGFGSIGYQKKFKDNSMIQIKPFVNYELEPQLDVVGWGFYRNLKKSKNLQAGIGFSYLF